MFHRNRTTMPFPWTKTSVAQISQIVADLNSPKRRRSLVVQTGFPTSLVDLFVKNRRRFTKPSSNNPGRPETPDLPPPPEAPTSISFTVVHAEPEPELVAGDVNGDGGSAGSGPVRGGSGSKTVLATVLTMLAVVVLISSVEKVAAAITVSAFALLFLENAGKRVVSFLTRWVRVWVWYPRLQCSEPTNAEEVEGESVVVEPECGSESDEFLSSEEFEVGVCSDETELECVSSEMPEDSMKDEKFVGSCKGNNRGVKFKSMMKKLLSKKLGSFRKEGKDKRTSAKVSEAEATVKNHKSLSFEMKEEQKDEGDDGNRAQLLVNIELECVTENDVDHADTFSEECSLTKVKDVTVPSEGMRINGVGNSGLIILFFIALVGLVAGRFAALVLTMTCCFMVKIVATRGRYWKVPLIKSSVPKI